MRRSKRLKIVRISLAMAVAAIIPVTAHAKPIPASGVGSQLEYQLNAAPIQQGVSGYGSERDYVPIQQTVTSYGSEREYQLNAAPIQQGVSGYGSEREYQANAVPVVESVAKSSDDRHFSRAPILESTPVTDDGGSTIDVNPYVVSGFGAAFLLALGMALAIRHNRKTKLSPA